MKKQTINKFIQRVSEIIANKVTIETYCSDNNIPINWFSDTFQRMYDDYYKEKGVNSIEFEKASRLWTTIGARNILSPASKSTQEELIPASDEEANDERNEVRYERENGKIVWYHFKIARKDKSPLVGKFSREDMNTIYKMYSYYGLGVTQKDVSREFPEYSLIDFKRILRVFNITKACSPFAPHMLEEHTEDELIQMTLRAKEDKFLARVESERIKNNEKLLDKYAQEAIDLRNKYNDRNDILQNIHIEHLTPFKFSSVKSEETLVIYLSDMHIGARVDYTSLFGNYYDESEVKNRLSIILNKVVAGGNYKEIVVCNLGDSLDGMDMQTCRRDHLLPQNMNNKEQVHCFISIMTWFMHSLSERTNKLSYFCVGESNHDGDFGWVANIALGAYLEGFGVDVEIFDKFINHVYVDNLCLILAHGKDNKDMKKNWPLLIDPKTESIIQDYIEYNNIVTPVTVVKGDLHQSAVTYTKRFKYKSVGSLFGASEWVQKNFGNTRWACDYSIVRNGSWIDGRVTDADM